MKLMINVFMPSLWQKIDEAITATDCVSKKGFIVLNE